MAGILKSKISVYEFDLDEMKRLIAVDLDVLMKHITVEYIIREVGGDPMDRFPGHNQVVGVRVTVNVTKENQE